MKFLFEKRNPAYLPLLFFAVILGSTMGIIMLALLMQINGKDIGVFQVILSLIASIPSVIFAFISTIVALRTEKGLSPFAAGIIGGLSSCFVVLVLLAVLQDGSPGKNFIRILGIVFGTGFICELICFLITPERKHEKVEEAE